MQSTHRVLAHLVRLGVRKHLTTPRAVPAAATTTVLPIPHRAEWRSLSTSRDEEAEADTTRATTTSTWRHLLARARSSLKKTFPLAGTATAAVLATGSFTSPALAAGEDVATSSTSTAGDIAQVAVEAADATGTVEWLWTLLSGLPASHAMTPVLVLALAQVALGAFDNIYHHEIKERLPWTQGSRHEQTIHCVRGALYTVVFSVLAGATPHGAAAYAFAGLLAAEAGLTLYDFVVEDSTRKSGRLCATERITHTLLTLNYGAMLALWLPLILVGDASWAAQSTGIEFNGYGLLSLVNLATVAGVGAWSVRDFFATRRLARFDAGDAASPHSVVLTAAGGDNSRQRILVTGATGFLGSKLCGDLLAQGHAVTVLARDATAAARTLEQARRARAHTATRGATEGQLTLISSIDALHQGDAYDVIFNLAGEPIAGGRWTEARVQRMFDSRVGLTRSLVEYMAALPQEQRPPVMVSASAIGYYGVTMPAAETEAEAEAGGSGGRITEESAPVEVKSLSHRLCAAWEEEAQRATSLGVRVVTPRIGIVLGRDGGALADMLFPFEFGLGGPMGNGRQVMPWIHVEDLLRVFAHCANDSSLSGAVNAVAPGAVTNNEFTATLARVLRRPAVFRQPPFVLRLMFGADFADELLLATQPVVPAKLMGEGAATGATAKPFSFRYDDLESALVHLVKGEH